MREALGDRETGGIRSLSAQLQAEASLGRWDETLVAHTPRGGTPWRNDTTHANKGMWKGPSPAYERWEKKGKGSEKVSWAAYGLVVYLRNVVDHRALWQGKFSSRAEMEQYFLHECFPSLLVAVWRWAQQQDSPALEQTRSAAGFAKRHSAAVFASSGLCEYLPLASSLLDVVRELQTHGGIYGWFKSAFELQWVNRDGWFKSADFLPQVSTLRSGQTLVLPVPVVSVHWECLWWRSHVTACESVAPASRDVQRACFRECRDCALPLCILRADMRRGLAVRRQEHAAERHCLVEHAGRHQVRVPTHGIRIMHPSADRGPDAEGRDAPRSAHLPPRRIQGQLLALSRGARARLLRPCRPHARAQRRACNFAAHAPMALCRMLSAQDSVRAGATRIAAGRPHARGARGMRAGRRRSDCTAQTYYFKILTPPKLR